MDMILDAAYRQQFLFLIPKNSGYVFEQLLLPLRMDQLRRPATAKTA